MSSESTRGRIEFDVITLFATAEVDPDRRPGVAEALREGYYDWPRQVTAADLAADLDISKSTVLEHLRKAESKVIEVYGIE